MTPQEIETRMEELRKLLARKAIMKSHAAEEIAEMEKLSRMLQGLPEDG